jgi:CubicO group peptidase (beta-lactamase class C family)
MKRTMIFAALMGSAALFSIPATAAQRSCTPRASTDTNTETPAIFELRRQVLNPWFMPIAYHSIDSFFETRQVPRGAQSTPLPHAERPLDFSYRYDGKTIPADQMFDRTFTNALMIVKDGTVVYENYRNFTNAQSHFLSMSMAKSITSILIGIAIDGGSIHSLDDQITQYVPELKGSAYDGVTIRDAIDMKSGVDRSDSDQLKSGTVTAERREQILVRNAIPAVCEALMVGRKTEPGKTFDYSTLNTTVLGWVLERATKQPLVDYTSKMLWQPLGAESSAFWIMDGTGPDAAPINGFGFNAVMRDYARLGLMMLNGGKANGKQIVSARWVEESTGGAHKPTSPGAKTGYQHFWWTVPDQAAYLAIGLAGQIIYVDPATRTVVVKLSYVPLDNKTVMPETMAFLQAASKWPGK